MATVDRLDVEPRRANTIDTCYTCGLQRPCERQHYPVPARAGGKKTVPMCVACHDATDRIPLERWSFEEYSKGFTQMWHSCGPEGRRLIVKIVLLLGERNAIAPEGETE